MKRYVVGFLFSPSNLHVALIRKEKPAWQKGLLNGPGGKVEEGEEPHRAMMREFYEEASVLVPDWRRFFTLIQQTGNDKWIIHFYVSHFSTPDIRLVSREFEEVSWYPTVGVIQGKWVVPNLRWLIPMALDGNVEGQGEQLNWPVNGM